MPPQVRQLLPSNLLPDRMQSRNDPLNRSTRPLLERKHFAPQPKKKNADAKLHGFNDFNSIPRQYDSLGTRMNMYGEVPTNYSTNNHLSDSDSSSFDTPHAVRRNDLLGVKDWSWKPVPPPRVPPQHATGIEHKDNAQFLFGVSQNTFLPAYNTPQKTNNKTVIPVKNGKKPSHMNGTDTSPNTSQVRKNF